MTWRASRLAKVVRFLSGSRSGTARHEPQHRRRLLLEPLEDRCVPTTITPTTFADGVLGSGSLRDAVLQFNADTGTGDDTIQLLAGTYTLTIRNTGGRHETAGLEGDLNITSASHRWIIQGAGSSGTNATIIDAGQLQDRVWEIVTPGKQVVFRDLVIQGGLAQDDGSNGARAGTTDALGGGLLNNGGNITLDRVVVQNNVALGGDAAAFGADGHNARGGGFYSSGGALTIGGLTLANNQAMGGRGADFSHYGWFGDGGLAAGSGLYATGGSLDIANSMIANNRATGGRGGNGVFVSTSSGGYYAGGTGGTGQGGGLYVNGGSLTIASSTIASNQGTGGSAGLYGYDGAGQGGGLYTGGTLTVSNSTLSGNSASVHGGGIFNDGTLTVSNSTLSGNSASGGGAIYNYYTGTLTVSNSTLSGNTATYGGGFFDFGGTLTVSDSTLSGNTATYGGGFFNFGGTLTVSNSIVALNSGDPTTGSIDANYNLIGGNPRLSPLQDNGGPTKTIALLASSPALNAGNPAQLDVADQRGVVRRGDVNIGAYQASASALVLTAPTTATAGTAFNLTVKAVDTFGQTAVGYTGTVHFSSTDGQAALPDNYPFTSGDAGMHTFSNAVTLKTAGTKTVTATDTVTGSITGSASVSVNPAAANHLVFLQQPTDTAAGHTIGPAVTVEIVDQFGNVVTSDNTDTITLSVGNNPSGGTLSGTLTVTVRGGIATFGDLSIDLAGVGYTLHARTAGLTDADSGAFSIT
jgi:hypothetical protein